MRYLFILDDDTISEVTADNLKSAVTKTAEYIGCLDDIFTKSLNGFEENDKDGIIKLFNKFSGTAINMAYIVDQILYENI